MKHIHVYLQKATIQHTTQYHKPIIKQIRLRILFIDYYDYYDLYIFFFKSKKDYRLYMYTSIFFFFLIRLWPIQSQTFRLQASIFNSRPNV